MQEATAFDGIDREGRPISSGARTTISNPDERDRIEGFLKGGGFVLGTSRQGDDLLDPARGSAVPTIYRTDGIWLWPLEILYYLREHDTPVQNDFLNHMRHHNYTARTPEASDIQIALRFLEQDSNDPADLEICIVRVHSDNRSHAAFVIDSRNYASPEEYRAVVLEAYDQMNSRLIDAEFESSPVGIHEPPPLLPTWEHYYESLPPLQR